MSTHSMLFLLHGLAFDLIKNNANEDALTLLDN